MITPHLRADAKPAERLNETADREIDPPPAEKAHASALAHLRKRLRNNVVLMAVSTQVMPFHYWISDPPMTDRDRNKLYIIETRKASKRRRLAGR